MKNDVVSVNVDATIEEAALIMYKNKIGGMPVVSNMGAVVGVITETDIFKTFVDVMGLADGKTRTPFKHHKQTFERNFWRKLFFATTFL